MLLILKPYRVAAVAGAIALAGIPGCDDRSQAPPLPVVAEKQPDPPVPPRPTTQELVTGERVTIALGGVPFEIRAPGSWAVKEAGGESLLTGPTPFGSVEVRLNRRPVLKSDYVAFMIDGAKKEPANDPSHRHETNIRSIGGVEILERRGLLGRASTRIVQDVGMPPTVISPTVMWKLTAFVPRGSQYDQYELNFEDLHDDQYQVDKEFLSNILSTLRYDPSARVGG